MVRDETWRLIHLLGALSELATALVPQVGSYPQRSALHTDDGGEPGQHVAHACRGLTELRHALDDAQRAAREVYTALSHLSVAPRPDGDAGLSGHPGHRPTGR